MEAGPASVAVVYYDRHAAGSLLSRVAHDSEALHGLVHQLTGGFLLQILQLFGVGMMLIVLSPKLALWTLVPVPLVFGGGWLFWHRVYPRYWRYWDASSKQSAALGGMLAGIRVVKAFGQEHREHGQFVAASDGLKRARIEVEQAATGFSAGMQLVFGLGGLIVWYVGGRDVLGQRMTLGALIAFLAYLAMFYAPLATLSHFTAWLTAAALSADRFVAQDVIGVAQSWKPRFANSFANYALFHAPLLTKNSGYDSQSRLRLR